VATTYKTPKEDTGTYLVVTFCTQLSNLENKGHLPHNTSDKQIPTKLCYNLTTVAQTMPSLRLV